MSGVGGREQVWLLLEHMRMSASHVVAGITGCTPRAAARMLELPTCWLCHRWTDKKACRAWTTGSCERVSWKYRKQCW